MAVKVEYIEIKKETKRVPAIKKDGTLSIELGEALVENYPGLFEIGAPIQEIAKLIGGK